MSKTFGCLFERTEAKFEIAQDFIKRLRVWAVNNNQAGLIKQIDSCTQEIKDI